MEFGKIHFEWDGVAYEHDPVGVTVRQATVITGYTTLGLNAWDKATDDLDIKACVALYWLIKDEAGEKNDITDMGDDFPLVKFMATYKEAVAAWLAKIVEAQKAEDAAKESLANPKGSKSAAARKTKGRTAPTSAG